MNFNATFVDDANIYIGDGTLLAPNVTIITAMHPISLKLRTEGYGYNKPVYIGKMFGLLLMLQFCLEYILEIIL